MMEALLGKKTVPYLADLKVAKMVLKLELSWEILKGDGSVMAQWMGILKESLKGVPKVLWWFVICVISKVPRGYSDWIGYLDRHHFFFHMYQDKPLAVIQYS